MPEELFLAIQLYYLLWLIGIFFVFFYSYEMFTESIYNTGVLMLFC